MLLLHIHQIVTCVSLSASPDYNKLNSLVS